MFPLVRRAFFAAAVACAACTPQEDPCFNPQSIIRDLRVLGVRSDPPEALVDLDAGSVPAVAVRVLAADPSGPAKDAVVTASLCVPDDAGCPPGSPQFGAPTGTDGEARFAVQATPALVRASRDADPLLGFGGIRVQLDVAATSPSGTSTARKTLLYTPQSDATTPNHAVEISGVELTRSGSLFETAPANGLVIISTGIPLGVRPVLAPGSIEQYQTTTLDGRTVQLIEHISYNFYGTPNLLFGDVVQGTSPGNLQGGDVADEPGPGDPEPTNGLVRFQGYRNALEYFWVVARDGRGAVAWTTIQVNAAGQDLPELFCR
jgi:hypothetical protein